MIGNFSEGLLCRVTAEMTASGAKCPCDLRRCVCGGSWADWEVSGYDMSIRLSPEAPKTGGAGRNRGGTVISLTPRDIWVNEQKVWPKQH